PQRVVIRQRFTPDRHRERRTELLGFLKFTPCRWIFKAVEQKQAPEEGRLCLGRPGVRKVRVPEVTLDGRVLGGLMLGPRVAPGHWLDVGYGENNGNRGTGAQG